MLALPLQSKFQLYPAAVRLLSPVHQIEEHTLVCNAAAMMRIMRIILCCIIFGCKGTDFCRNGKGYGL